MAIRLNEALDTADRTCGQCRNFKVLFRTPSGRPQKGKYGECTGVLTLVKPIAYHVTIEKKAVWHNTEARGCPLFVLP